MTASCLVATTVWYFSGTEERAEAAERRSITAIQDLGGVVVSHGSAGTLRSQSHFITIDLSDWHGTSSDLAALDDLRGLDLFMNEEAVSPEAIRQLRALNDLRTLRIIGAGTNSNLLTELNAALSDVRVLFERGRELEHVGTVPSASP